MTARLAALGIESGRVGSWGLLALTCAAPVAAQTPTFSSRIEAVRVDVLVTDGGAVVSGLQAGDFEVRDNGVLQDVQLADFGQLPVNVILGLDASASVSGARLEHLQGAGWTLLDRLGASDRAALLTFSHVVRLREELTTDIPRVRAALGRVLPEGSTALVDGSYAAVALAGSDVGRGLVILFSDGVDTSSWLTPATVLESARRSDAVIYGVAVRGRLPPKFLSDVSGATGGAVLEIESTGDLARAFVRILDEFRQRYVLSFTPRGVPQAGWHRLEVRVKGRRATVNARAGYEAGTTSATR